MNGQAAAALKPVAGAAAFKDLGPRGGNPGERAGLGLEVHGRLPARGRTILGQAHACPFTFFTVSEGKV